MLIAVIHKHSSLGSFYSTTQLGEEAFRSDPGQILWILCSKVTVVFNKRNLPSTLQDNQGQQQWRTLFGGLFWTLLTNAQNEDSHAWLHRESSWLMDRQRCSLLNSSTKKSWRCTVVFRGEWSIGLLWESETWDNSRRRETESWCLPAHSHSCRGQTSLWGRQAQHTASVCAGNFWSWRFS